MSIGSIFDTWIIFNSIANKLVFCAKWKMYLNYIKAFVVVACAIIAFVISMYLFGSKSSHKQDTYDYWYNECSNNPDVCEDYQKRVKSAFGCDVDDVTGNDDLCSDILNTTALSMSNVAKGAHNFVGLNFFFSLFSIISFSYLFVCFVHNVYLSPSSSLSLSLSLSLSSGYALLLIFFYVLIAIGLVAFDIYNKRRYRKLHPEIEEEERKEAERKKREEEEEKAMEEAEKKLNQHPDLEEDPNWNPEWDYSRQLIKTERSCTNVCCLGMFIIITIIVIVMVVYSIMNGDPDGVISADSFDQLFSSSSYSSLHSSFIFHPSVYLYLSISIQ